MLTSYLRTLLVFLLFHSEMLIAEPNKKLELCQGVWPPYTLGEELSEPTGGIALEFVNEISNRISIPIAVQLLPWKRCVLLAKEGKKDGISLLTISSAREEFLEFSKPILADNNLVWFLKDREFEGDWQTFEDLKGLKVGVTSGYNYGDEFKNAISRYHLSVEDGPSLRSNFIKLGYGRIDVYLLNMPVAQMVLKDLPELRHKLSYNDKLFEKVAFAMGLSKQSKASKLIGRVNKAIEDMKQDETVKRIMQAYLVPVNQ